MDIEVIIPSGGNLADFWKNLVSNDPDKTDGPIVFLRSRTKIDEMPLKEEITISPNQMLFLPIINTAIKPADDPISSYLLLIGLYYSSKSVAFDKEILITLKNRVKEDPSAFLSGISSAELSKTLESTVESIVKRTGESTQQTFSELPAQDAQDYLAEVIEEIRRSKKP
jgi:hypothetical protein